MEIKIEITAIGLESAINHLAAAIAGQGTSAPATVEISVKPEETVSKTDLKKQEIAAQIEALGHTPPTKGSVAKFEEALAAAQEAAENTEPPEEEEPEDDEEIPIDDVITLAYAVSKSTPKSTKGKLALKGCLKQVKAEKVSECTPKQLKKLVPLLEDYLGKKLANVLEEAD